MATRPRGSGLDELLRAATAALANAYAPYSRFPVGAAVLSEDGRIFAGCNVENASYPVGTCAEAGAIAAMVAGGGGRLRAILILGGGDDAGLPPCGACRQRILEFALPDAVVHCAGPAGIGRTIEVADLLPHSFGASDLRR
jgi:cytidine deaminase